MLGLLTLLTLLLLWARKMDRQSEYLAYMPGWYKVTLASVRVRVRLVQGNPSQREG